MKSKSLSPFVSSSFALAALRLLAMLSILASPMFTVFGQGTAFTYQGRLNDSNAAANGIYDLTFTLFATNTGGTAIAGPVTNSATSVSNGLFATTIDFGSGVFTGTSNWLEIAAQTNGGSGFTTLTPRQQLTPAPYAIFAGAANGVNGLTVLQTTSGAPNIIGGASVNYVSSNVVGATIAGGGATNFGISHLKDTNSVTGDFGTVGGGAQNTAAAINATVSGGTHNTASGQDSTVGGGDENTASGNFSVVSGGFGNTASGLDSLVGGGANNLASNQFATVTGGQLNVASNQYATVSGGNHNIASGIASFAAGAHAQALHDGSFVWADNTTGNFASTVSNQFSVRATGGIRLAGDVQIDTSAYHNLSLTGGNSLGFLYGSYAALGDGIHIGYNYYADALGTNHIINTGGATSRISMGYGSIALLTGYQNGYPYNGLTISGPSVPVSITYSGVAIGYAGNASAQTAQAPLDVQGDLITRGNGIWNFGISSSGNFGFVPAVSGQDVSYIDTSGNYHQVSDRGLKRDITPLDNTLDRLLQLRPVSYHFKSAAVNAPLALGFIAQEILPLFPEVVGEQTNNVKDIVYSELIPVTIRSVQELNQKLENESKQKDAEIQNLKHQNESLEARLTRLESALRSLNQNK